MTKKYTWNKEQLSQYTHSLNEEEDNFSNLSLHLTNSTNPNDIDENILKFANLMSKVCDPLFAKNLGKCKEVENSNITRRVSQPWFDDECQNLRNLFYTELNKFRHNNNYTNQTNLANARSNFKKRLFARNDIATTK